MELFCQAITHGLHTCTASIPSSTNLLVLRQGRRACGVILSTILRIDLNTTCGFRRPVFTDCVSPLARCMNGVPGLNGRDRAPIADCRPSGLSAPSTPLRHSELRHLRVGCALRTSLTKNCLPLLVCPMCASGLLLVLCLLLGPHPLQQSLILSSAHPILSVPPCTVCLPHSPAPSMRLRAAGGLLFMTALRCGRTTGRSPSPRWEGLLRDDFACQLPSSWHRYWRCWHAALNFRPWSSEFTKTLRSASAAPSREGLGLEGLRV